MKINFGKFGWVEATEDIDQALIEGKEVRMDFRYDEIGKAICECNIEVMKEKKELKEPSKFFEDMAIHAYKILANQGLINAKVTKPRSLHNVICDIELFVSNELDKEALLTDIAQAKGQLDAIASAVEKGNYKNAYSIINPAAKYYE